MSDYTVLASEETLSKTVSALEANGFSVQVVDTVEAAKAAVTEIIPRGARVFTGTSKTLEKAGIDKLINESGDYDSLRNTMHEFFQKHPDQVRERKEAIAAPDYMLASAAAITQDGQLMVASATGSQLAPEAYGASHVIYVVSTQKIVDGLDDGIQRIKEYIFPQETVRLQAAYNNKDISSHFNKLLVYREDSEKRVQIILVKELAGF